MWAPKFGAWLPPFSKFGAPFASTGNGAPNFDLAGNGAPNFEPGRQAREPRIRHLFSEAAAVEPIEITLLRQWASYIAVPTWLTDNDGRLIYFNESVEPIIGIRFDEAGDMLADDLSDAFEIADVDGTPLPNYERPLLIALNKQMPAHRRISIRVEGTLRILDVTAIPLLSTSERHLGAMATIWEPDAPMAPSIAPPVGAEQFPIEVILTRRWASYLAVPIWITDPWGNLTFCNEPATAVTGVRPAAGNTPVESHTELFRTRDLDGRPLSTEDLPIATALNRRVAAHRGMRILGLDGVWRTIEVSALPLIGQNQRFLGGVALFWETGP